MNYTAKQKKFPFGREKNFLSPKKKKTFFFCLECVCACVCVILFSFLKFYNNNNYPCGKTFPRCLMSIIHLHPLRFNLPSFIYKFIIIISLSPLSPPSHSPSLLYLHVFFFVDATIIIIIKNKKKNKEKKTNLEI